MSIMDKVTPPVDSKIFQKAVKSFGKALSTAEPGEDRAAICVGAVALACVGRSGLLVDNEELFQNVCWRVQSLDQIICQHHARVLAEKRFPQSWIATAATAKLVGMSFDPQLFAWPTEPEAGSAAA
jgi:hypothetical protein